MKKEKLQPLSVIDNTGQRIVPRLIIGDGTDYPSGDILDANAVLSIASGSGTTVDTSELEGRVDTLENKVYAQEDVISALD